MCSPSRETRLKLCDNDLKTSYRLVALPAQPVCEHTQTKSHGEGLSSNEQYNE